VMIPRGSQKKRKRLAAGRLTGGGKNIKKQTINRNENFTKRDEEKADGREVG